MIPVPKYKHTRPIQGFSFSEMLALFKNKSVYSLGAKSKKAEGNDNIIETEGRNSNIAIICLITLTIFDSLVFIFRPILLMQKYDYIILCHRVIQFISVHSTRHCITVYDVVCNNCRLTFFVLRSVKAFLN